MVHGHLLGPRPGHPDTWLALFIGPAPFVMASCVSNTLLSIPLASAAMRHGDSPRADFVRVFQERAPSIEIEYAPGNLSRTSSAMLADRSATTTRYPAS